MKNVSEDEDFATLMRQSSLGSPEARRALERVPTEDAQIIRQIAELQERIAHSASTAEAAKATLALVGLLRSFGYAWREEVPDHVLLWALNNASEPGGTGSASPGGPVAEEAPLRAEAQQPQTDSRSTWLRQQAPVPSGLIDMTEMYLRTILELEEEGVVPVRARIAERLGQGGPTVSQAVARMERDGLLSVAADRHLELTEEGRRLATRVMRKHRLAECLLVDVIGLEWEQVHTEACRWQHVMSEAVERRILELLRHPTESPYGNPIPGLDELGERDTADPFLDNGVVSLSDLAPGVEGKSVVVRHIGEPIQSDAQLMYTLRRAGVQPGSVVSVTESAGALLIGSGSETAELPEGVASHVYVWKA